MKKFELLAASAILMLPAMPAFAQDAPPAPPVQAAPEAPMTPDIVVTAQRQSERLQDVPIAVSAFTANALEKQQIVNPTALQQSLPNITFTKTNFTSSSFTIRGVGDLCTGTTCDSATAIHVNDMPLLSTRLFESEFFDLERVEVLRGPQGTLFGRNATSGVVNFITAKPDLSGIHANGEFEYGNYDTKEAKGMLNLPLGPTLGIRIAGLYLKRDGFTDNLYDNSQIDGRDLYSLRGTLSWEPDPNTRLDLMGYYFHERDDRDRIQKQMCHRDPTGILGCLPDSLAYQTTNGNSTLSTILSSSEFFTLATSGATIPGTPYPIAALALGSVYGADAFSNALNPTDNRTVDLDYNPTYYAEEQQYQAKFFHDFGNISLNLTGGYAENKVDSRTDYTDAVENPLTNNPGLGLLAALAAAGGGAANPFVGLANTLIPNGPNGGVCQSDLTSNAGGVYSGASVGCYPQSLDFDRSRAYTNQWSIEGHIDSHFSGMFNFLLGGIYVDQKTTDNDYYVGAFGLDYGSGVLGLAEGAAAGLPGNYFLSTPFYDNDEVDYRLKSYGIFGETYFQFSDKLKLTIGLRYNHDQKALQARTTTLDAVTPYGATSVDDGVGAPEWTYSNASFSRLTGRAVLDYKITNNNLLYFSYSRGYKSGGINPPVPAQFDVDPIFRPEQVDAFELGSKNTFLHGQLTLNLTGFYYKYKDMQLARIVDRTAVNDNVSADIYGIEAEAIIRPIPQFTVNANVSYLHSRVSADEYLPNPRDPSGGDTSAVIIKDITNASNCAVASNIGSEAAAIGYVDTVNAAIGSSVGNPALLHPAQQVLSNGTYGAYSVCAQLEANTALAAGIGGVTYYGSGVPVNIRGNKLPQAPTYKFAVGAQYTIDLGHDSALIPRVDLNYTGNSYASIFNQDIDRMPGYAVVNAQVEFDGPGDKFYVRGFVKNLTNNNAVTGQYVTDQSSGLFTNVFTIEPRQYGVAVGFKF